MDRMLFELPPERAIQEEVTTKGKPWLRTAERHQVVIRTLALDQMLPADDEARIVWAFVESCDLSEFYGSIAAVEGEAGRNATDPKILLALWLFATIKAVGSARELHRLCERHLSYQWICGDVSLNYHTLSDFRTENGDVLDLLLTQQIAALKYAGAVTLERVAQDGVRVRASAGKASFRRRETLDQCLADAKQQVEALKSQVTDDPGATKRRETAAKTRAAEERLARVASAVAACQKIHDQKVKRGGDSLKNPARASTTDPDARVMKTADGGFRPAFNVQFATDTNAQVIVGVDVVNEGTDAGQLKPMADQIQQRTGVRPKDMLADGSYSTKEDIQALNKPAEGHKVYSPVKDVEKQQAKGQDPFAPRSGESAELTEWRTRMGTTEAKTIYIQRAATAECVNALARQRGLVQFRVRGLTKVRTIAVWCALAHNLRRWAVLCAEVTTDKASR